MLVSIIIPLYNAELFIADTIKSAIGQTWPDKEIIIVDDGSADNSYEVAKTFEQYDFVKVYKRPNSGSCATRNFGFAKSKGDYIQYLDCDDALSPDKITAQLALLGSNDNNYVASCGWGKFTHNIGEATFIEQEVWKDLSPVQWLTAAWMGGGMMQTACWLTPRKLIEDTGPWDESLLQNPNDDGEFFCRVLLQSGGVKFCSDAKVYYRMHAGTRVSTNKSYHAVNSLLQTCMSYERQILKKEHSQLVKEAIAHNYASFIYLYHQQFPGLAKLAGNKLKEYGFNTVNVQGAGKFNNLSAVIGFNNAIKLKGLLSKLRS